MDKRFYALPKLPYDYDYLAPAVSAEQLQLHHDKHHNAYVEKANELLKLADDRGINADLGSLYKKMSFNVGGHVLHSLFWDNLAAPFSQVSKGLEIEQKIIEEFSSMDNFIAEFTQVATTIEGSGWAVLFHCPLTDRLLIGQLGNHNLNVYPTYPILLLLDMWEHAYYVDYKNDKKKYVENFRNIINWKTVNNRYMRTK